MPDLEYFLVAESSAIDVNRNTVSIFHVLNDVKVVEFPAELTQLVAVSGWIHSAAEIRDRHESQIRLEFALPGIAEPVKFRGNLRAESRYQHYNFRFRDIPIDQPGEVVVMLFLDDVQKATHTMTVSEYGTD